MGPSAHPDITLYHQNFAVYKECSDRDDWDGVGDLMLEGARKLANIGADFIICPANTAHISVPRILPLSPIPWLHIADAVLDEGVARHYTTFGLLGTKFLVESSVYDEACAKRGLTVIKPSPDEIERTSQIIHDDLLQGVIKEDNLVYYQGVIKALAAKGCQAVILGCTEIPLMMNDDNSALPTLDSTRLLAEAAVRRAVQA